MTDEVTSIRAAGRVKWFNQFKGYGFVEVENVAEDVFLHFSALNKSGIDHLNNEDIILCDIVKSNRGYQITHIVELLHSNKYEIEGSNTERVTATMKWFNPSKGFGFAQLDSGTDVFIHSSILKKHKLLAIEPGQKIELLIHYTNFGHEALDIVS